MELYFFHTFTRCEHKTAAKQAPGLEIAVGNRSMTGKNIPLTGKAPSGVSYHFPPNLKFHFK